jgi:hypothetical protein
MGASHHRKYFLALLGLGAGALVIDRAILQPDAADAAQFEPGRSARSSGAEPPEPSGEPLPAPSVPILAQRIDSLEAPQVTPDIFKADPAEWGLPAPGDGAGSPDVELRLGAIMNADNARPGAPASCAVINSRIMRVGGTVAGFVVERITPTSVHLRRGDQTRELRLAR